LTKRVRAYIGLGANVGDAKMALDHAVAALAALPGVRLRAVSPLYRTKPVGGVEQPDFLNAVASVDVPCGPDAATGALALLAALKHIEYALGRQRRARWGPREIDLDLLVFGRHRIETPTLTVPHREMQNRLFVLAPLADLAPGLRPPGWQTTVRTAAARLHEHEQASVVARLSDWDSHASAWQ
jgi:2-amino-4-hydroxy-6-hydroxymethyldihydropteridine diphosphokinase